MKTLLRRLPSVVLVVAAALSIGCASAQTSLTPYERAQREALDTITAHRFDGGRMWTFDDPPTTYFREAYGFQPDSRWLEDVRMSALRYTGCSASFVSGDGLVMTNEHCVRGNLVAVSKPGEKLIETGFFAPTLADERKVPNAYLDQLVEIRDVTRDVLAAMDAASTDKDKVAARARTIEDIQRRAGGESGLRAQVVTLYNGGKYALYIYKRYTDVRLVFAPELGAAHFGREWDNFTYPRYAFDCSFLRVYGDDGKPLHTEHYFRWSAGGAAENELVFVIGNPGRTSRLSTVDQLEYNRDVAYPYTARMLNDRAAVLTEYMDRHPESRDAVLTQLLGVSNSQKAYNGRLAGLRNDVLMQRRRAFDRAFRAEVGKRPALEQKYGHIWDQIAKDREALRAIANENFGLRMMGTGVSEYLSRAFGLVQLARETARPESERGEGFRGERLATMRSGITRFRPINSALDELQLARNLVVMRDYLGANDPIIRSAFDGRTPADAAKNLIAKSVLGDSVRFAALAADDAAASAASDDPFLVIARMAAPRIDKVNAITSEISARDQVNATLLGRALYDVYGTSIPPDATFTLRIADGVVKGYEYNGTKAPAWTTMYGVYDRHFSAPDDDNWALAPHWQHPPAGLDLATPMNFASTNDIIGGNSGSPMINARKEIVGLIFDGNIESLPGDFIFAEDMGNRTVSVHSSAIRDGLKHIYKALRLVTELETGRLAP